MHIIMQIYSKSNKTTSCWSNLMSYITGPIIFGLVHEKLVKITFREVCYVTFQKLFLP